jgi:hypothetical protein
VAALLPLGLIVRTLGVRDRIRDLVAFNPAWEAQIGAAKMCTAACLSIGAGATVAAPAVTVVAPIVAHSTPTPQTVQLVVTEHHKKRKPKATPTATPLAPRATPTWTATPVPTTVAAQRKRPTAQQRAAMLATAKVPTGGGESEVTKPLKTPTPAETATPVG